jgi:hypothetical protein
VTSQTTIQQLHWKTLLRQRGELLVYNDGVTEIEVTGVLTRPSEGVEGVDPSVLFESKQWDVLIAPGDLLDEDDNEIIPKHGHTVTRVIDDAKFEVVPGSTGGNCFRWSDALKTWRRVHLTLLGEV